MYSKFRTHRSSPSRLNGVAPMKKTGVVLVRKKCRISAIPFRDAVRSARRPPDCLLLAHRILRASSRLGHGLATGA